MKHAIIGIVVHGKQTKVEWDERALEYLPYFIRAVRRFSIRIPRRVRLSKGKIDWASINECEWCRATTLFLRPIADHKSLEDALDSLAHELAHIRHWKHGPKHSRLTEKIRDWIKGVNDE